MKDKFPNLKISGFWNDADGLTLHEFIALWVMIIWAVVMLSVGAVALILTLKDRQLSNFWVQYLDMFSDIPLAVIIGLFGQNAIGKFGEGLSGLKQVRQEQQYQPNVHEIENIDKGSDDNADCGNQPPV